jgi:hypothetical protein
MLSLPAEAKSKTCLPGTFSWIQQALCTQRDEVKKKRHFEQDDWFVTKKTVRERRYCYSAECMANNHTGRVVRNHKDYYSEWMARNHTGYVEMKQPDYYGQYLANHHTGSTTYGNVVSLSRSHSGGVSNDANTASANNAH